MKQLKNQTGSILLLVLVVAPIAAILFFSLIDMALVSRKQSVINRNVVAYNALLDASLDYTTYAVKNHWCMTPQWQRDLAGICNVNHPMNLERLMLDPQSIKAYFDKTGAPSNILIKKIQGSVRMSSIPALHPLFQVVKNLDTSGGTVAINDLTIEVERLDNANIPRRGRETYLQITVSLVALSPTVPFFRNFTTLKARSRIMVTPRELNYFSLIVPRDLYLDGTPGGNGDFSIPPSGGKGISFESPVYVNGDIHVPASAGSYTPVTFSSKVIVGATTGGVGGVGGVGGRLMSGGAPLAPPSGGDSDSIYSNLPGFGGFKKGVDMDGARDDGLDVLSGNLVLPKPVLNAQLECVDLNAVKSDLDRTKESDLAVKLVNYAPSGGVNAAPDDYTFNIGLTNGNMFIPQDVKPYKRGIVPAGATLLPGGPSYTGKSIIQLTIKIGTGVPTGPVPNGREAKFIMSDGGAAPASGNIASLKLTNTASPGTDDPVIKVTLAPFLLAGVAQPHLRTLKVAITGRKDQIGPVEIGVIAFDVATWTAKNRRIDEPLPPAAPNPDFTLAKEHSMSGAIHFTTTTNTAVLANVIPGPPVQNATYVKMDESKRLLGVGAGGVAGVPLGQDTQPTTTIPGPDEFFDYYQVTQKCQSSVAASSGNAFTVADWGTSFLGDTRHTWHFAPAEDVTPTVAKSYETFFSGPDFVIPDTAPAVAIPPATPSAASPFLVKSIVGKCVIPATTSFIAGFLVCDRMTILPRVQPLSLYGTYIFKEFLVDPSAVAAGITFRSIYHPQATIELRAKNILRDNFGGTCNSPTLAKIPVWWPELTAKEYTMMRSCGVVSLRDQANPFTWTTVDPDCGLVGAFMNCKHHPTNFLLTEISRESDLQ